MPLEGIMLEFIFKVFVMTSISGWIPYWLDPWIYVKIFLLGLSTYLVVALLEYKKIQGIPLDTVLKNRE
jgi:putative ABC transport system permease protein